MSCRKEVPQTQAKLVLQLYLCTGCGAMTEKAVKELELETARALEVAKHTLAQYVLQGGLLRPRESPQEHSVAPTTFSDHKDAPSPLDVELGVTTRKRL